MDNPLTLRLDDLKRMEQITQTITLECAGNGRSFYNPGAGPPVGERRRGDRRVEGGAAVRRPAPGAPRPGASHVVPDGNDAPPTPQAPDFIRSHPIWKAMEPHTMIALEMNGRPLPHLHGGPARLIVPGWIGSASLKWLVRLTLADKEWGGPFMQRSYRSPRAEDPTQSYSLQSLECKSLDHEPARRREDAAGAQMIQGYAWAGEGSVTGVDVSLDGGKTWAPAALTGVAHRYAWRRWELPWTAAAARTPSWRGRPTHSAACSRAAKARDPQGYRWNVIHAVRVDVA